MGLIDYLLEKQTIRARVSAGDWEQAVRAAIAPLVAVGAAEERYADSVIGNAQKNGPYFVLMPGVALPHARPEQGALGEGFSLITLDTPIEFGQKDNDPVNLLLSFAATDPTRQLEYCLGEAVTLLESQATVDALSAAPDTAAIEEILRNFSADQ